MVDLAQAEFTRLARGGEIVKGDIPPSEKLVLGISSSSRAAIRRVHNQSVEQARSVLASKLRRWLLLGGTAAETARRYQRCVEAYIEWDDEAAEPAETPTKGMMIRYDQGIVRCRPDVVLGDGENGPLEVRLLLWDELGLTSDSAEIIASPALERVEETYGQGNLEVVKVLHLPTMRVEEVSEDAARSRRPDVEDLLSEA